MTDRGALIAVINVPPVHPPLSALLREVLFTIIRAAVAANGGDHRAASRFLKVALRDLTMAIARCEQIADTEKLPRK